MKKGHLVRNIILTLILLIVIVLGVGYWIFKTQFYDQTNYVEKGTYGTSGFSAEDMISAGAVAEQTARKTTGSEEGETDTEESEATLTSEAESELIAQQQEAILNTADQMFQTKNTYNILLLGVDRRDQSWNGNSDLCPEIN